MHITRLQYKRCTDQWNPQCLQFDDTDSQTISDRNPDGQPAALIRSSAFSRD